MFRLTLIVLLCSPLTAAADEAQERFVALPHSIDENESGVWIIDTLSGEIRYCLRRPAPVADGGSQILCVTHRE